MRPRLGWLLTLSILVATSVVAQSPPDFSGHWVLVRPERAGPDVPTAMIVEQPVVRRDIYGAPIKPGFIQITVKRHLAAGPRAETFRFGESGWVSGVVRGGGPTRSTRTSTRWEGNRLVIDDTSRLNDETTSRRIQVLEYDADGQLVVTVTERSSGIEPKTTTATYRRQTAAGQVAGPAGLPAIERHRVGPVAIGGDAQKIYDAFAGRRELVDLAYEGMLAPALLLRFAGMSQRDGVVAELGPSGAVFAVWRIEIRDPGFRTAKGIGIGSTVGELRSAYRLHAVVSGEGGVGIRVEELSATFGLDVTGPGSTLWKVQDPAQVPDSVKIKSVLLTR